MVDASLDTTGFQPLDLSADAIPLETVDTSGLPASPLQIDTSGATDIIDAATGVAALMGVVGTLIESVVTIVKDVETAHPAAVVTELGKYAGKLAGVLDLGSWWGSLTQGAGGTTATRPDVVTAAKGTWIWLTKTSEGALLTGMLEDGMGVDTTKFNDTASKGLSIADSMVGFAIALQFGVLFVEHAGSALLGSRWPKTISETIAKLPEEMGLSWALGLILNTAFESALGESLNNAIRKQTRPNEPEWPIVRTMLRQHVIADEDLTAVLENSGLSDEWIERVKKLEFQPLPIGDIQALYQAGFIEDTDLTPLLHSLGFTDHITGLLKKLYIEKAETSSGSEIRVVARSLFRQGLISESDYTGYLTEVNFPDKLIADDIKAINLEKSNGWKSQSVAVIKSDYLHTPGSQSIAVQKLQQVGYSSGEASDMVNSWTAPPIRRTHGLSQAQILKYYVAGIKMTPDALTQLVALGMDSTSAQFLLDHPLSGAKAHVVRLTPALVTQAYIQGAIAQSDLLDNFKAAGATGDALQYLYDNALYKYAHHHVSGSGTTQLSEGHILSAFKYGIFDSHTATTALEGLGYSEANAHVLLGIEEKGQFKPTQPPAFASLTAAYNYLISLGLQFDGSIDPTYESALQMVVNAGFVPVYPPNWQPPTLIPPLSGGGGAGLGSGGSVPPPGGVTGGTTTGTTPGTTTTTPTQPPVQPPV